MTQQVDLPRFDINIESLVSDLDALLKQCKADTDALVEQTEAASWQNLMQPMEEIGDKISRFWSPVSHINSVKNSDELRAAYENCLPIMSQYYSELGQNQGLFERVKALAESDAFNSLDTAQKKAVSNSLRDFKLSGVALEEPARKRYAELQQQLSELGSGFSNNVLDATNGWSLSLDNADRLTGVPESALALFKQNAVAKEQEGYRLTLDFPSYLPVMQHAEDRELRRELYTASATRASEQGPQAGQWDNGEKMVEILACRAELAKLLGFENYAELSLATKMAESPQQVIDFLDDLAAQSRAQAEEEFAQLQEFAEKEYGVTALEAWDLPYYSERLREQRYAISQEALRPYFPLPKVVDGLFEVVGQLFDVSFEQADNAELWHDDASCYHVLRKGERIASFYFDLYAREHKRGGAWMSGAIGRRELPSGGLEKPVAFLVCNFTPPTDGKPSLLNHNEVTTLFHEFGHGLHHMLTQVNTAEVAGINGVAWDAVELPSQFLENWCWAPEVIPLISGHYQTGEALPEDMLNKILAAKNFQSAMQMLRQVEFSLFDLKLHIAEPPKSADDIQSLIENVRKQVSVVPSPAFNRFQHSFSHIFAGGYAAGYYSYKWAEVLSADAFSLFEENGVMDKATGERFLNEILERGGSAEPMELFKAFRGREPSNQALLRHSGIQTTGKAA